MAPKSGNALEVKRPSGSRSPSRSPKPKNRRKAPAAVSNYGSDGVKDNNIFSLSGTDYRIVAFMTLVAAAVRLFRIYQPSSVVFDEVQYAPSFSVLWNWCADSCPNSFGGFASKYIKGRFFMDVHPPLAKLLITLAGWLAGFDGEFDFKEIGKDYLEPGVPYVAMRMLPAVLGVLTVPLMFLTLKVTGCQTSSALMGATAVLFGIVHSPRASLDLLTIAQKTDWPHSLAIFSLTRHWYFSRL